MEILRPELFYMVIILYLFPRLAYLLSAPINRPVIRVNNKGSFKHSILVYAFKTAEEGQCVGGLGT